MECGTQRCQISDFLVLLIVIEQVVWKTRRLLLVICFHLVLVLFHGTQRRLLVDWLRRLLVDFLKDQKGMTVIFCDNKATISMNKKI